MNNENTPISADVADYTYQFETKHLKRYHSNLTRLLAFIEEHREELDGTLWTACHINCEIQILQASPAHIGYERNHRAIARRWVGRVWTRVKNEGICGTLDWLSKGADGEIPVRIVAAEKIKWLPEPNTVVTEANSNE